MKALLFDDTGKIIVKIQSRDRTLDTSIYGDKVLDITDHVDADYIMKNPHEFEVRKNKDDKHELHIKDIKPKREDLLPKIQHMDTQPQMQQVAVQSDMVYEPIIKDDDLQAQVTIPQEEPLPVEVVPDVVPVDPSVDLIPDPPKPEEQQPIKMVVEVIPDLPPVEIPVDPPVVPTEPPAEEPPQEPVQQPNIIPETPLEPLTSDNQVVENGV